MKPKLDFSRLRDLRKQHRLDQKDFWPRFGVTQSAGSRYEGGSRPINKPLAFLVHCWHSGKITDQDLAQAAKALGSAKRKGTIG
jgi:transcriptional regulator with XRE-family HTH domain